MLYLAQNFDLLVKKIGKWNPQTYKSDINALRESVEKLRSQSAKLRDQEMPMGMRQVIFEKLSE